MVMADFRKDARAIMASAQKVSQDVNAIVAGVRQGKGTVGKLLTDDALYRQREEHRRRRPRRRWPTCGRPPSRRRAPSPISAARTAR